MKTILVCKMDGLSNSIKNLLSSFRIAKINKLNNYKVNILDHRLYNIFNNLEKINSITQFHIIQSKSSWYYTANDISIEYPKDFLETNDKYNTVINKFGNITYEQLYHHTPKQFINEYKMIINNLIINPKITNYVNNFKKQYFNEKKILGIHIRTWNGNKWKICKQSEGRYNNYYNYNSYITVIKKYIKEGYTPFICSDDSDLLYKLKKEYDIIIHDHLDNNIEYTKEQCDFIDILLLGFCDIFVGSFLSSFSELVYYFSNDIQKTIII